MCGIVGVVSNCANGFSIKEMAMFAQLLFLDTVRGFDSTGVFGVSNNKNVVIHKDAVHGLDFIQTKEFKEFKGEMVATGKFVVGHNRAATRGTITDKNAHPFWIDDKVVLVQNGTYKGDHKHLKDTEVDTEAVAHVIAENKSVEEALQKINASYALVWYNTETSTLNLIRNTERPLYLAKFYGKGLVFASEAVMIQYAAAREDVKLEGAPEEVPAGTHVAITLDGKGGYSRVDTKIDAGFRFRKGEVVDETEWYQPWRHGHQRNAAACAYGQQPALTHHRPSIGKDDIKQTFAEAIVGKEPKYLFSSSESALADIDAVNEAIFHQHHYVEMLDYLPANDHPSCTAWHVYGSVIADATGNTNATTLVHWIVYDKTEEQVVDMCTNMFYKAKLSTIISRKFITGNEGAKWLNTVYASFHEEIQGVPQP